MIHSVYQKLQYFYCRLKRNFKTQPKLMTAVTSGLLLTAGYYFLRITPAGRNRVVSVYGHDPYTDDGCFVVKWGSHRGCGYDVPENSLEAFKYCIDNNVDLVEFDVCATKDNVLCVCHDDNLLRLTGENMLISKTNWEDLKAMCILKDFTKRNNGPTHIPSLNEVLDILLTSNMRFIIDLKTTNSKALNELVEMFQNRPGMYCKGAVSGFNICSLYKVRKRDSKIVTSLAYRPYFCSYGDYNEKGPLSPRTNIWLIQKFLTFLDFIIDILLPFWATNVLGVNALVVSKELISPEFARIWHEKGVRLITWNVNEHHEKMWYGCGMKVMCLVDTLKDEKKDCSLMKEPSLSMSEYSKSPPDIKISCNKKNI